MIELDYPAVLELFRQHLDPKRTESASYLIWFLENYYRLDTVDAVDSVCDQRGDKGVDGIYINEADENIDVFQCRIAQKKDATIGDTSLKEFYGTLSQFTDRKSVENLINTAGRAQVALLAQRLDLQNKIETHNVRGVFVSNVEIDANGEAYLTTRPEITFVGPQYLRSSYISDARTAPIGATAAFDISGFSAAEYILDAQTSAVIVPVKARELVRLQGIADQSLFDFNVRASLGGTQVNRDIVRSIKDPTKHRMFPLFHNGITIICADLSWNAESLSLSTYYVVNGAQSLTSLHQYQDELTDDLRILTKFIRMGINSPMSELVTRYSNNQNGVKPRDFKSNNPIQIRLQNEFNLYYLSQFAFEIKRGEQVPAVELITNEIAGLYLMAFDLKEPWATHRKYQVFDEKYADLFGRPEVTADRIVMCHVLASAIRALTPKLNNKLFGKYTLTAFAMLYILRLILENDNAGQELLSRPQDFVRDSKLRSHLDQCVRKIVNDVIIDVNAEVDEFGDDFDYRGKLRDADWVRTLSKNVVANYLKLVQRGRIDSFAQEWAAGLG